MLKQTMSINILIKNKVAISIHVSTGSTGDFPCVIARLNVHICPYLPNDMRLFGELKQTVWLLSSAYRPCNPALNIYQGTSIVSFDLHCVYRQFRYSDYVNWISPLLRLQKGPTKLITGL